jgi:hypothetical protein
MPPQPADEFGHGGVAPHPSRKPGESAEGVGRVENIVAALNIAIHAIRVRPVSLNRDRGESALFNQRARNFGAQRIEIVRAVGGFAEEHERCVADLCDDALQVAVIRQRISRGANHSGGIRCSFARFHMHVPSSVSGA